MSRKARAALTLGVAGTAAALLISMQPAWGDPEARPGDAVGVGSDTVQNAADFLFNGDTAGDPGFNTGTLNSVYNYFATGDNNGRALYNQAGQLLYGNGTTSQVLRAGTEPVERPDGSGAGISSLTVDSLGSTKYDNLPNGSITFARASRLPKGSEQTACQAITDCGGLHVFQFATDNLEMADYSGSTPTATNAFPLSAQQLYYVYTHCDNGSNVVGGPTSGTVGIEWSQVPGAPVGASTANIIPVIPQSGSGTRNFFETDLGNSQSPVVAQSTVDATITSSTCMRVSEEHDPTGITGSASPPNAIEPFSAGKIGLIQSGYYGNSQEAASDFAVQLIPGCVGTGITPQTPYNSCPSGDVQTANDGNPVYDAQRGLYFIARDFDLGLTPGTGVCASGGADASYGECKPAETGTTKNWVNTLFKGTNSWVAKSLNAPLIEAAGLTPNYSDLGDASSG